MASLVEKCFIFMYQHLIRVAGAMLIRTAPPSCLNPHYPLSSSAAGLLCNHNVHDRFIRIMRITVRLSFIVSTQIQSQVRRYICVGYKYGLIFSRVVPSNNFQNNCFRSRWVFFCSNFGPFSFA